MAGVALLLVILYFVFKEEFTLSRSARSYHEATAGMSHEDKMLYMSYKGDLEWKMIPQNMTFEEYKGEAEELSKVRQQHFMDGNR